MPETMTPTVRHSQAVQRKPARSRWAANTQSPEGRSLAINGAWWRSGHVAGLQTRRLSVRIGDQASRVEGSEVGVLDDAHGARLCQSARMPRQGPRFTRDPNEWLWIILMVVGALTQTAIVIWDWVFK